MPNRWRADEVIELTSGNFDELASQKLRLVTMAAFGTRRFEVYVIADACGDVSAEAHDRGMDRMVAAGARPMTSLQHLLELQRDWARATTYDATTGLAKTYGGAYGLRLI
jgi:hypothetical protein